MDKATKSLIKVETEMCYLEREGLKYTPKWKNKNSYRSRLVREIYDKK